jgi:hypothetical protein
MPSRANAADRSRPVRRSRSGLRSRRFVGGGTDGHEQLTATTGVILMAHGAGFHHHHG